MGDPVFREHRLIRRVQFYETDVAGIVHFSWFFRYMEEAEHALWRKAGISVHPPDSDIDWPCIATSFEYYGALTFEQEFEVTIQIVEIGRKTIRYTCLVSQNDRPIASGAMTTACVRLRPNEPMRAIEIPPEIVQKLSPAPAGKV